jgi:hypothetical protein
MTVLQELIYEMRWPYSATPFVIKRANDLLTKEKEQKQDIVNKTLIKVKEKMETDKIHQRVLDIQNNIQNANPEQQTVMLNELLELASQIEQSLAEIKIDIDEIETNEE